MANITPTGAPADVVSGNIDLNSDTFKMLLLTASASPSASWARRSDVTNEVAAGGGYSAGGVAMATPTVTTVSGKAKWVTDTVDFGSTTTITARWGVIYKSRGGVASADELLQIVDFGSTRSSAGSAFTVAPDPVNGWILVGP